MFLPQVTSLRASRSSIAGQSHMYQDASNGAAQRSVVPMLTWAPQPRLLMLSLLASPQQHSSLLLAGQQRCDYDGL